jgi:hypothetical protein
MNKVSLASAKLALLHECLANQIRVRERFVKVVHQNAYFAIASSVSLMASALPAHAETAVIPNSSTAAIEKQVQVTIPSAPILIAAPIPGNAPEVSVGMAAIQVISPTPNAVLDIPAATVVLRSSLAVKVELRVNGALVDSSLIGRTETDTTTKTVTQTWYGVSLQEGENTITANLAGTSTPATSTKVKVRGAPASLKVRTVESRIPADGRSTVTIQGELLDQQGNRSNRDGLLTLSATAGEFVGDDASLEQPEFQVKVRQGQFSAQLRSGLEAKTVRIRAVTGGLEAFTQINFETNLRPSIATGVIDLRLGKRGTDFYRSFRDFLPIDRDYSYQVNARAAVFATGRIGEWLFTGAYNSDRPLNKTCDDTVRLFREQQFCDQNYPVYGDSSESIIVTPSIDSVFLRFERTSPVTNVGTDYAMWGDFNTEEFARRSQEFTSTTRQLHGFKANYNIGNLQITGLFANNVQGFQRDTIAPDGTSGFYFVSRRLLVEGSEDVFLESEELNRPGTVLERKRLNRNTDYEIDYDRGSILFRQPILRTDLAQDGMPLVRRIIVTYQYDTAGSDTSIYAGRTQYHFSREQNRESWIGATYFKENQGDRNFELYGADAFISLGANSRLLAEYARSNHVSDFLGSVSGSAYRVELEGEIARGIQARAYYRSAESGFANNATVSFTPGQTRYGTQAAAAISRDTNLRFQYDHEDNKGIASQPLLTLEELITPRQEAIPGSAVDNSLTTISAGIQQRFGASELTVDWLHRDRRDRLNPSIFTTTSDQLRSRFTLPINQRLTFLAQNETTLSSQVDAVYNDRTLLGLNWSVVPGVNVQLAQQFFTRGQFAGQSITSLGVTGDYKLGSDTTLSGRYSIFNGANRLTAQGAIGLNHKLSLSPGLRMDFAYEHVFGNFLATNATGAQFLQPFAPGQSAASVGIQGGDSYSVGIEYTGSKEFQASARFEHRNSTAGSNTVFSAGATGKLSPALTALLRYQQASAANQTLSALGDTANLKLGLAYRDPNDDRFNALLRYEYRKNPSSIPDSILFSSGSGYEDHLFALEGIYAPNWQWEFYGKFALRDSTSYLASDLVGTSTVTLTQARATYRFNYHWDLVGEVRWINQANSGFNETGFVLEAGYYLTPNLRLAAGYSFGRVGDRDFDGSRSAGGLYLGLTVKVNELFNGFGLQKIPPPKIQPDQVTHKPVERPTEQPTANNSTP